MKLKAAVYSHYSEYSKKHFFSVVDFDMTSSGYAKVQDIEVEFEPPPESVLIAGTVDAYRAQQQKIKADAQVQYNNLEKQIQEMLCIENKSGEAAP